MKILTHYSQLQGIKIKKMKSYSSGKFYFIGENGEFLLFFLEENEDADIVIRCCDEDAITEKINKEKAFLDMLISEGVLSTTEADLLVQKNQKSQDKEIEEAIRKKEYERYLYLKKKFEKGCE